MIEQRTLADIIRQKVYLGSTNSRGFNPVKCPVCNDYQERGAFKFDADTTGYNCYNCGAKFKYEEGSGKLSKNARDILSHFGIERSDLTDIRSAMFTNVKKEEAEISLEAMKKVKLFTPEVALPEHSYPIGHDDYEDAQLPLAEYLVKRKIDPLACKAYFSLDKRYLRRVIIPYFRDGKIIYWQARTIDDGVKPRYLNSPISRDAVIYGYDELFTWREAPLFVTEGVFDAISLNGICILGSALNEAKLEVLKRCRRRLIFVIDRDKTGEGLGKAALDNGWEISFVDERAADANKSVQLFGLPYTIYTLLKNATTKPAFTDQSQLQLSLGVLMGKLRGTK